MCIFLQLVCFSRYSGVNRRRFSTFNFILPKLETNPLPAPYWNYEICILLCASLWLALSPGPRNQTNLSSQSEPGHLFAEMKYVWSCTIQERDATRQKASENEKKEDSAEPMKKLKAKGKTPYTQKFVWGWKQDNKGNPIRNWLRTTVQRAKNVLWFLYRKRGPCKNPLNTHDLGKSNNVWCVWWNVWCPGMRHQTKCLVC